MQTQPVVQQPVYGPRPETVKARLAIVTSPAFRLGFLDAQAGRPLDHDHIFDRIERETPPTALARMRWHRDAQTVSVAQYRYEEGRRLVLEFGARCRAWGHPDFPPAQVLAFCERGQTAAPTRQPPQLKPAGP